VFQALQRGIKRSMVDQENILRLLLDGTGNALAVLRTETQCSQDQQVKSALEKRNSFVRRFLGSHSTQLYSSLGRVSNPSARFGA